MAISVTSILARCIVSSHCTGRGVPTLDWRVPTLDEGGTYLGWRRYLPWMKEVPTLDEGGTYLGWGVPTQGTRRCEQTDTCENSTFLLLRMQVAKSFFCGTTNIAVLDFWWCNPAFQSQGRIRWLNTFSPVVIFRFTSDATPADQSNFCWKLYFETVFVYETTHLFLVKLKLYQEVFLYCVK